jgi:demethylmenaquinone methyltransferase / 2-methoxy-6-polyprenyl-1,4-benzoquinol methylase
MAGVDLQNEHRERARALDAARGGREKRGYVREMFSDIAPSYDFLNHLLSFNIDKRWRRRALRALAWEQRPEGVFLDLCAGTLDIAAELVGRSGFRGRVVGADFAEPMLRHGSEKVRGRPVHPVTADALSLPLASGSCDGAIVGFGVRNLADLGAGIREVHRVLKPGARFVILEFTTPPSALIRAVYHQYFYRLLPRVAGAISGNRTAYRYLADSIVSFPSAPELASRLQSAGFSEVRWELLTFGVAAIHVGVKT